MDIKRSPGLILTGIGIVLALLTVFAPDAPFAPSGLFLPVMLIFVGRAVSRGARVAKQRPTPTVFKMPPTVPPQTEPRRPAKPVSRPAPAPIDVVVADPAPAPTEFDRELEEKLRAAQAAAEARSVKSSKPQTAPKPVDKPAAKTPLPTVGPTPPRGAVYPGATPSSTRAKSSKEMVEEARKRITRK